MNGCWPARTLITVAKLNRSRIGELAAAGLLLEAGGGYKLTDAGRKAAGIA
jgi:hypothetical protein